MQANLEQLEKEADDLLNQLVAKPEPETGEPADAGQKDEAKPVTAEPVPEVTQEEAFVSEERYKNAQARMTQATQESAELRRQVAVLQQQVEQLSSQPAPAQPEKDTAQKPDYKVTLKSLVAEYPELLGPVVAGFEAQDSTIHELQRRLDEVQRGTVDTMQRVRGREENDAYNQHKSTIKALHPDAYDIAQTDDFQGWIARQTPMVQQAVTNGTAADVVDVLNRYKGQAAQPRTEQRNASQSRADDARASAQPVTPRARQQPTNAQPRFTRAQIASMSPAEFAKNEPEIDKAMAQGLIY